MRERGIPEDQYTGKASKRRDTSQIPKSKISGNPSSHHPEDGSIIRGIPQRGIDPATQPQVNLGLPSQPSSSRVSQLISEGRVLEGESTSTSNISPSRVEPPTLTHPPIWLRWSKSWLFWATIASLISGGVGFLSMAMLLKLPSAPNCPAIFWPLASASMRLGCAQVAANKQNVDDLLRAIALVEALPKDHPLRSEINSYVEQWSRDILTLADEKFQEGQLEEAIAIAQKIPQDASVHQTVDQQIQRWQATWSEGEKIYQEAEAEVRQQHWRQAFIATVRLLNLENNYWATTKYEELNRLIETTRADAEKLAKAESIEKQGGADNLLKAVQLAESIGASSFLYKDAQALIPKLGREMLDLAQAALDRKDAQAALDIANKIPPSTGLEAETQDFITMADAWRNAWAGTVPSLENAIAIAQRIGFDRPSYNQAQELISQWKLEIEDVAHLEKARELAQGGTVGDFNAAIAEASLIPSNNPRASEAKQEMDDWRRQVETIEDQPILNRAENLAVAENIDSLQVAIDEASQITSGRALYPAARRRIRSWTSKIERIQDQPYLDQARLLASEGNLPAAIAAAQQIRPGRALSKEAQAAASDWQGQIRARENWREAQQVALQGTPDALAQAISLAQQVPTTSPLRYTVEPTITQWSQQILRLALFRGRYDLPGGIEIAKKVPSGTEAYRAAREQIDTWERILNPPPPVVPAPSPVPVTISNPPIIPNSSPPSVAPLPRQ